MIQWILILLLFIPSYHNTICPVTNTLFSNSLNLQGDDNALMIDLPFNFSFYCNSYDQIGVSTNGLLTFDIPSTIYQNTPTNSPSLPFNFIAPFWTDLIVA